MPSPAAMLALVCLALSASGARAGLEELLGLGGGRGGPLPDLEDLRRSLHDDDYGRTADLGAADLEKLLRALGYEDVAVRADGKTLEVIVDSPGSFVVVRGTTLQDKVSVNVEPLGRSVCIYVCSDYGFKGEKAGEYLFAEAWDTKTRFAHAYVQERALCLQEDVQLTKYDEANVELVQKAMEGFVAAQRDFQKGFRAAAKALPARRLDGLDDLVEHLRRRQGRRDGPLPDLPGLVSRVREDEEGRLARPSAQDLLQVVKALGYTEASTSGKGVAVLIKDPLMSVTAHGEKIKDRAAAGVVPYGGSVTINLCMDAESGVETAAKVAFAMAWNEKWRFLSAYYDIGHGMCLEDDVHLTKYDKANLQILQMAMAKFARLFLRFHVEWLAVKSSEGSEASRRLQYV